MMLADLNGKLITQWSTQFSDRQRTPKAVCSLIHDGLKVMCHEGSTSLKKVLHMTAGAPGITNVDSGVVLSAPNLHEWNEIPLRAMLERETGIPSLVENARTSRRWRALARLGGKGGVGNFVFIAMGTGVGAGIFLQGRLHHGADWSAGEIGYMGVNGVHANRAGAIDRTTRACDRRHRD